MPIRRGRPAPVMRPSQSAPKREPGGLLSRVRSWIKGPAASGGRHRRSSTPVEPSGRSVPVGATDAATARAVQEADLTQRRAAREATRRISDASRRSLSLDIAGVADVFRASNDALASFVDDPLVRRMALNAYSAPREGAVSDELRAVASQRIRAALLVGEDDATQAAGIRALDRVGEGSERQLSVEERAANLDAALDAVRRHAADPRLLESALHAVTTLSRAAEGHAAVQRRVPAVLLGSDDETPAFATNSPARRRLLVQTLRDTVPAERVGVLLAGRGLMADLIADARQSTDALALRQLTEELSGLLRTPAMRAEFRAAGGEALLAERESTRGFPGRHAWMRVRSAFQAPIPRHDPVADAVDHFDIHPKLLIAYDSTHGHRAMVEGDNGAETPLSRAVTQHNGRVVEAIASLGVDVPRAQLPKDLAARARAGRERYRTLRSDAAQELFGQLPIDQDSAAVVIDMLGVGDRLRASDIS